MQTYFCSGCNKPLSLESPSDAGPVPVASNVSLLQAFYASLECLASC